MKHLLTTLVAAAFAAACAPAASSTTSAPSSPQATVTHPRGPWTVELHAQASAVEQRVSPIDEGEVSVDVFTLSVRLRDDRGDRVATFELGEFAGNCELACGDSAEAVELRCWENIPGVPFTHYAVESDSGELWLTTTAGECGYHDEQREHLSTLPDGVELTTLTAGCE